MPSDVRQAAERLRPLQGAAVDTWNAPSQALEDMWTLAAAYLAEHPADDAEPITEEWLRACGADELWDVEKEFRIPTAQDAHLAMYCPSKCEGYACCLGGPSSYAPLPDIRTRGQLRLLCRALGIELKEAKP